MNQKGSRNREEVIPPEYPMFILENRFKQRGVIIDILISIFELKYQWEGWERGSLFQEFLAVHVYILKESLGADCQLYNELNSISVEDSGSAV